MGIQDFLKSSVILSCAALCENFRLSYELLKTEVNDEVNKEGGFNLYSILVVKTDSCDDYEYDFVYDVSRDYDTAKSYLNTLCSETVTPISLRDVLYDIM